MNKKSIIIIAVAILVSGGIGTAVGASATATPPTIIKTVTVPGPERIVNKDVPGPERIVTKTVTVNKVPQVCLDAFDGADAGFKIATRGFQAAADALAAVANLDVAAITKANEDLTAAAADFDPGAYATPRDECKSIATSN